MGSIAYGCNTDDSDIDLYGFCMPPKDSIFPHLRGEIQGFGRQINRFEQWQEHGIEDKEARKKYDFTIFSIVKYFQLLMENNPNIIDSLFVPLRCVLHSTKIGNIVRENRRMFLHKGAWPKFRGYSYSQLHKADTKNPIGKRKDTIEKYGVDVKFLYHVVRLLNECEMILETGDIDLERDREILKSVRRGEWSLERVKEYFSMKEKSLEELYAKSTLPVKPDEDKIKQFLLSCIEEHYGSLDKVLTIPNDHDKMIKELSELVNRYMK
jgi:predicted nucleotidyltransferase